jgi:hypothetical protein
VLKLPWKASGVAEVAAEKLMRKSMTIIIATHPIAFSKNLTEAS